MPSCPLACSARAPCHLAHVSPELNKSGGEDEIDCASLQGYAPMLRIVCSPMGLTERVLISSFGIYPCPRVTLPTCPLNLTKVAERMRFELTVPFWGTPI